MEVDGCATTPCTRGTCVSLGRGRYRCDCDSGVTGISCDNLTDGCALTPCQNNGKCIQHDAGKKVILTSCPFDTAAGQSMRCASKVIKWAKYAINVHWDGAFTKNRKIILLFVQHVCLHLEILCITFSSLKIIYTSTPKKWANMYNVQNVNMSS